MIRPGRVGLGPPPSGQCSGRVGSGPAPHVGGRINTNSKTPGVWFHIIDATFWFCFFIVGIPLVLLALLTVRQFSPVAIVLKCAVLVWMLILFLRHRGSRHTYAAAGIWAALLWVPVAWYVAAHFLFWLRYGMDDAGHPGSPMAFMFNLMLGLMFFCPLSGMLLLLALRRWGAHIVKAPHP